MKVIRRLRRVLVARAESHGVLPGEPRGILFLAPHPAGSRCDGYMQRVRQIDALVPAPTRWYLSLGRGRPFAIRHAANSFELSLNPLRLADWLAVVGVALHCGTMYVHSIHTVCRGVDTVLLFLPVPRRILDLHGAVPEEVRRTGRRLPWRHAIVERIAVARATGIVAVTQAMASHAGRKYRVPEDGRILVLPTAGAGPGAQRLQKPAATPPNIVYAGGTQPWQQVPKMLAAIEARLEHANYFLFLTPMPDGSEGALPAGRLPAAPNVRVGTLPPADLPEAYAAMHFGFLLREPALFNAVSCPTKLAEYLAHDIVPILDSPAIGDFERFGLQFVTLGDFLDGRLPDERIRQSMARANRAVLERLHGQRIEGERRLRAHLAGTDATERAEAL